MVDIFKPGQPLNDDAFNLLAALSYEGEATLRRVDEAIECARGAGLEPKLLCLNQIAWNFITQGRNVGPEENIRLRGLPVRIFFLIPNCPTGVKLLSA